MRISLVRVREVIQVYLRYLHTIGRSHYTIRGVKYGLLNFAGFLEQEEIFDISDLTTGVIEAYQEELSFRLTAKGTLLSLSSQIQLLCTVKGFTAFLKNKEYLYQDPGEKIKPPRQPKSLPKVILDEKEIRQLMNAPDMQSNRGYRNRIILEVLYDTAIRRLELSRIKLADLDLDAGYIRVNGKGDKERVVPLGDRVCKMIRNYILFVRASFLQEDDDGYLLLNRWGKQMGPDSIWAVVKRCVHLAGIRKKVSTHSLRHACATHMLRNGAPTRHLQEMLGHASLESTQIYTRVTINDLKKIHAKYHPRSDNKK